MKTSTVLRRRIDRRLVAQTRIATERRSVAEQHRIDDAAVDIMRALKKLSTRDLQCSALALAAKVWIEHP